MSQLKYKKMLKPSQVYKMGVGLFEGNQNYMLIKVLSDREVVEDEKYGAHTEYGSYEETGGEYARVYRAPTGQLVVWASAATDAKDEKTLAKLRIPNHQAMKAKLDQVVNKVEDNQNNVVIYQPIGQPGTIGEDHYILSVIDQGKRKDFDSKKMGTQSLTDGWSCGYQVIHTLDFFVSGRKENSKSKKPEKLQLRTLFTECSKRHERGEETINESTSKEENQNDSLAVDKEVVDFDVGEFDLMFGATKEEKEGVQQANTEGIENSKVMTSRLDALRTSRLQYFSMDKTSDFGKFSKQLFDAIEKSVKRYRLQGVNDNHVNQISPERQKAYHEVKATIKVMHSTFKALKNDNVKDARTALRQIKVAYKQPKSLGFKHAFAKWCGLAAFTLLSIVTVGAAAPLAYHFFKQTKRFESDVELARSEHKFTGKANTFLSSPQSIKPVPLTNSLQDNTASPLKEKRGDSGGDDLLGFGLDD